jgi:type IV pilus assembly protein PilE
MDNPQKIYMKTETGFTLIELLIVISVIAILTAVALPNYNAYVIRGKIAEATSTLSDGRVKMEQYFQDNRTYASGPAPAPTTYFTYAAPNTGTPTLTYTITATGIGGMTGFSYTIDQNNAKTSTFSQTTGSSAIGWANSTTCWVIRKSGSCT